MRKTHCPLASQALSLLKQSPYFEAKKGHDHTLVVSVNQNMNYFFHTKACGELFLECWNCSKLAIDEYLFTARDRAFEMKARGANWHAVPFPSDYHFDSRAASTLFKGSVEGDRPLLVSFLGNPRKFSPVATLIREALVLQCANHSSICKHGVYNHESHDSPNYDSRHG
jgi:hypothetical protein